MAYHLCPVYLSLQLIVELHTHLPTKKNSEVQTLPPPPVNVILFGNRVFADVSS